MSGGHKAVGNVVLMDKQHSKMQHVGTVFHTKSGLVVHPAPKKKNGIFDGNIGVEGGVSAALVGAGVIHYGSKGLKKLELWMSPPRGDGILIGHVEDSGYLPSEASSVEGDVVTGRASALPDWGDVGEGFFEEVDRVLTSHAL